MLTYNELKEKCTCWTGYKRKPGTKPCADGSCIQEGTDDVSKEKHHVMAFGRMNPITSGHEAVVNKVHSVAKEHGASHNVIVSHSQDAKKNPLSGEQKVKHAKNAFPETNVSSASKESPTILHHAAAAHKAGATHLHVVAGSDRHEEMHNLLHKYNDKDSAHGHYNFKKITVHSSGERDPDSEGTTGISASKMREHAASGNKAEFHKGAPSKMKPEHKDAMYNDVRKGMNIKEETTPYWKKPSFNKRMSQMAKQERLERERKEAEKKPVKEETMDQQDDHAKQLQRFKDQMSKLNGPNKETETDLDNLEKEMMGLMPKAGGLMHEPTDTMQTRHAKIKHMTETLRPEMGAETYIKDFISSTNPRFNNKSKEERRKMAIGAFMNAKAKGVKEEVQIDELSTDLLARYKTAAHASAKASDEAGKYKNGDKRFAGINKATKKQFDNDLKKHGQFKESNSHYDKAEENRRSADSAKEQGDMFAYHLHMSDHHDNMADWHDSKGRHGSVDAHLNKAHAHRNSAMALKEGTIQPSGDDSISTSTSAPSASTAKDTSMSKKIKGFKFFNGENDKQMNMNQPVKEAVYQNKTTGETFGTATKPAAKPAAPAAPARKQSALERVRAKMDASKAVKEGMDRQARQRAADEQERRANVLKTNPRIAAEVERRRKAAEAAKAAVKEENEIDEQAPVAPVPDRKYIRGTPEHKAYKATKKPINGMPTNVKEEVEELDELSKSTLSSYADKASDSARTMPGYGTKAEGSKKTKRMANIVSAMKRKQSVCEEVEELDEKSDQAKRNKTMKNMMDASRGARFKVSNPQSMTPKPDAEHKTPRDHNVAIGRALRNEAATGNPGKGYHGACGTADEKYEEMHKHVKNLTDGDDKTVKHYLDSGHGEKLSGREADHDHIKADFTKFMKYYRPEQNKPEVKEAVAQKGVNVDKVNTAGDAPHEEKFETVKKTKLKKEETMKSYKEFLQSLDEKLVGGQKKLDKNHNNKLDAQDFKMLRKEETEALDEIKMSELPSRKIQGKSYGADYNDPEGADETAADMKKAEKKAAGRKAGQSTGSYKPRATMSKLKQAGATYK